MPHLDGFPEVPGVCGVLKGVCSDQHHIQRHPAAPHVCNLSVIVLPRQHLHHRALRWNCIRHMHCTWTHLDTDALEELEPQAKLESYDPNGRSDFSS